MKKKIVLSVSILLVVIFVITIVAKELRTTNTWGDSEGKVKVIATLFPQYDFAKQIGKEKVEVQLLLPPGIESHTFEPTPTDIININNADLFIYTGEEMEPWADRIASSITSDTKIVDASSRVDLLKAEEEEHEEGEEEHDHEHTYDPHIWLDPENAIKMVEEITYYLCSADPENAVFYTNNSNAYISELKTLDSDIAKVVESGIRKEIAFGGPFSYKYFVERYNLSYISAYEACGEEAEPSVARIKDVIETIKEDKLPVVFYDELETSNIAKTISTECNIQALTFNTVHNVSKSKIDSGATYIGIMRENIENLKTALN